MNCFFCNSIITIDDPACHNTESQCWQHNVVHQILGLYRPEIKKVEFVGELKGDRIIVSYTVNPHPYGTTLPEERMVTVYKKTLSSRLNQTVVPPPIQKKILELPYPPITLTPSNYQEKLKTYLLFS